MSQVYSRYSRAFFECLLNEVDKKDKQEWMLLQKDLSLLSVLFDFPKIKAFLKCPIIPTYQLEEVLFSSLELIQIPSQNLDEAKKVEKKQSLFKSFFAVLIEKKRVDEVSQILKGMILWIDQHLGQALAEVFISEEFKNDEEKKLFEEKLEKVLIQQNKLISKINKFRFQYQLDESLLAGFKVKVNSQILDLSMKNKVDLISKI